MSRKKTTATQLRSGMHLEPTPPIVLPPATRECGGCEHFASSEKPPYGHCHRYPQPEAKKTDSRACGEFSEK